MNTMTKSSTEKSTPWISANSHIREITGQISLYIRNSFLREKPVRVVTEKLFTWKLLENFLERQTICTSCGNNFIQKSNFSIYESNCVFAKCEKVSHKSEPIIS